MKLQCLNCAHEFDGGISLDELGWHSVCPECGSSFDVDVQLGETKESRGTIVLGDTVMVSDPCYGLNTWCQGVIKNVLPGVYKCEVEFYSDKYWGDRVSAITITHTDYDGIELSWLIEQFTVGVDSGQAGIFDYDYYAKYHNDRTERSHVDDDWYDRVCDLTSTRVQNPKYVAFEWNQPNLTVKELADKLYEYMSTPEISWQFITQLDANTIDDSGFVSSSGYGDGSYSCCTARNDDGKVVSISIVYIHDDEDMCVDD